MRFEWDERKNKANRKKHGVSFETASEVFDDPFYLSRPDLDEGDEDRFQTLGRVEALILLLVVHTWHRKDGQETVRIISARKATPRERRRYEETEPD